jgi:hypothetical protein
MHREGAAFRSLMNCFAIADLARPAVRRAARGVRRRLRVHPLRAQRHRRRPRPHQDGDLGHRLHLPRARHHLPRPRRPGPGLRRGPPPRRGRRRLRPAQAAARPKTTMAEVHPIAVGQSGQPGRDERGPGASAAPIGAGRSTISPNATAQQARWMGYEGDPCPECGALTLVRNGTCLKCESCGATTGCSSPRDHPSVLGARRARWRRAADVVQRLSESSLSESRWTAGAMPRGPARGGGRCRNGIGIGRDRS